MTSTPVDERLRDYVRFLQAHHLDDLTRQNLTLARELDVPLLRFFEHVPEAQLYEMSYQGLVQLLRDLEAGTALDTYAETMRLWEADQLPGIPRAQIHASDLVLANVAQKKVLLAYVGSFTQDIGTAMAIVGALEDYYMVIQNQAFQLFTRLREQAVQQLTRLESEKEEAVATAEELQALNEELTAQAEELQSQQEELNQVYEQLRARNETVEHEVRERTRELEAANADLFKQRALLNGVLDNVPGAIGYCDEHLVIGMVNRQYAEELGKRVEDLLGRHVEDALPDLDEHSLVQLRKIMATGEPAVGYGVPRPMSDGSELYQDYTVVPVRNEAGAVVGLLSLTTDVTQRVLMERDMTRKNEQMERQKDLMERIIEQAPAGIAYMDADLVIRWLNPEFLRLFQRDADFFLNRPFFHQGSNEARERFEPILRRVIQTGEPFQAAGVAYRLVVDGQPRDSFWDFSYVPVLGSDRQVEGVLVFALEASNRIDRERFQQERIDQLQAVDRMKDEFLNALSFQINHPINMITGYATVLDEGAMGTLRPEQATYVKRILASAAVLLSLVNDLLDMSRLSAGKFQLERAPVNLATTAEKVVDVLAPVTEQQGLRVIRNIPPLVQRLNVDDQRIEQVLVGMVSTAINLTPPGGLLRVQLRQDDDELRFEVQHTGPSLSPEAASQLFERFTQVGGRWLGLTVARRQIEAHGGAIGVEPDAGDGNTFWFSLPLSRD